MFRKASIISLCLVSFLLVEHNSFAQEEGGPIDKSQEEVVVQQDSSIVFESGEVEHISMPTTTPFNIPSPDLSKKPAATTNNTPAVDKTSHDGEPKAKETKQDFSFNIIYYLIYKFKQVDN
ncbi:hypothetical protein [Roseivirga sp.]|uniref:hypothetical protein n=1 Tax=Roseivirga sp. TaxID=1964215 RepID=UPI003B522E96